ncbi:hypothetical protein AB1Y20_020938 [Prymnesium parvum]|uniref:Nucleotidyl transferase domain-containing protein n=1 Tax=Prymnesium parvum TaxID=97485 RepID=A0AB34JI89_PRYPA
MLEGCPSPNGPPFAGRLQLRDEASLNVMIPMGGSNEAFREAGYTSPKPLIKIVGRPMLLHLLDNLKLRLGDVVWLVMPAALHLQYEPQLNLKNEYPAVDIRVILFSVMTRGVVETLFIGLQHMSPADLTRRVLCLDCDTIYFSDVLGDFRAQPAGKGVCFYFKDTGTAALYSYLRVEDGTRVEEVSEKKAISDMANVGAYGFPSGQLLREAIATVLDAPQGIAMEYFISNIINKLLSGGHVFDALMADQYANCGTPAELEAFIEHVSSGKVPSLMIKRRFCFALDNVLVTEPTKPHDYSTCVPIEKNVQLVRELKEAGHHIIISTSRLMRETGGNVGVVIATCGHETLRMLEQFKIPYDEIHFGQPFAHVYVDASVACASGVDTAKDLGWRVNSTPQLEPGMVAARHFNNVQLEGDYVVKTASRCAWRRRGPDECRASHPPATAPPAADGGGDLTTPGSPIADGVSSLTLQRIKGVTFSHLITNRCLTPGRLKVFLSTLRKVHSSAGAASAMLPLDELDMGANYLPKVRKRFETYRPLYLSLSKRSDDLFRMLEAYLAEYEAEKRFQYAHVVHGDPVFSNVLLTDKGHIFLLDMRGEVGSKLTLQGDLTYDLSKVYQSLLGYDYIILNQPLLERDAELLEELRDTFRSFIAENYPQVLMSDVVKLTASHYFGIVPLHQNPEHQAAYLRTASALLSSIPKRESARSSPRPLPRVPPLSPVEPS